ncbi:hypothetical protein C8R43DRAFT_908097, partial [Mycena crocata]
STPFRPFFGREYISVLCSWFITKTFGCRFDSRLEGDRPAPRLPYFVAYVLHHSDLEDIVLYAALVLLERLKVQFPDFRSTGRRLFLSAYMVASKILCDASLSTASWRILTRRLFANREINQMEGELCGYLQWNLNVDYNAILALESSLKHDFWSYIVHLQGLASYLVQPRCRCKEQGLFDYI